MMMAPDQTRRLREGCIEHDENVQARSLRSFCACEGA